MMRVLLQFLSTVVVFVLLSQSLPGFEVDSWGTAVLAALVFGFVNATLGTVLRILSLPLIVFTLGLFYFVVNAFVLLLVSFLFGHGQAFHINGWWPAIVASVVLAALGMLWKLVPKPRRERDAD
jgi:putative membrane protein